VGKVIINYFSVLPARSQTTAMFLLFRESLRVVPSCGADGHLAQYDSFARPGCAFKVLFSVFIWACNQDVCRK
jgi:hypothetical protein